jgi:indole-3-acetate monooxygenase
MNHVSLGPLGIDSLGNDPVARARDLGPEIAAAADEIERSQAIPEPLLTHIHEARLPRILLPRSVGGDQLDPWTYLHAIEEISRHDASVGWNLFVANSAALIAPFIPLETARAIFTDQRAWVSWGPPNQYKAHAEPGGYRVSGEWHFASGSRQATWMGAHCQVTEPDGSVRLNRFGRPTTRTLLFRKEHAEPIRDWNTIGMRGTASEGYRVTDLFVPEAYSGTREDPALRRDTGPLYAFTMQGLYAVGVAAVAFGIARAMLDDFIFLATEKTPRGLQRLADSPVVQADVARREAQLGAARAWLVEILKDVWSTADEIAAIDLSARVRVRLGCAHAISSAVEVGDYVYKAAGTSAIFRGTSLERRFRDIHTLSQQIQSRDSHFEAVGRVMFNGDPDGVFL